MLQTATVHPATLAILKKVMQMPELQQFNLVGGTSLSLQIGHRISIDLEEVKKVITKKVKDYLKSRPN